MRLHPNAKTTPRSRALMVRRVLREGWAVDEAADAGGVSRRTVYKWMARFRAQGKSGLQDRSSAPQHIPNRTPARQVRQIERLRRRRLAAFQIARLLGMARSTVSAVLVRLGLNRLRFLEPLKPVRRYEKSRPGELLHLDTKKLARIKRIGHRIHGDRSKIVAGAGWEYAHVCVDDNSRVAYVEVLDDERGTSAVGFLERAVAWFAKLGVHTEAILTDNGSCYVSKAFGRACERLALKHRRTRPYRPQTNGKAERFIQTLQREWAYGKPYHTSRGRRQALHAWLNHYNWRRPHGSLEAQPPITRIEGSG